MKKALILGILTSSLSFASTVCSVNSDELLKTLLAQHPSIKMSNEAIKGAKERISSAKWGYFPTPSVEVSGRDSDRNTVIARLDQPIWTGGKITSKHDIAISKEQESLFELEENSYKLMENFFTVLENYLQASSQIKELDEGLKTLYSLDEMLERRMEAGISSVSDKELLRSRIEQINSDMILAKNRYKIALMQLELMLDKKVECEVELKAIKILHSKAIEDSVKRLVEFHPSLKKIQQQIQTSKYEVDSVKASYFPNLSLRAEHKRGDLYNKDYDRANNQSSVYLTLNAVTGSGLSALSEVSAAKIKVYELNFLKQTVEKELIDKLLADYNNYEIAKSRIKVLENTVDAANKVLDSYTRLFLAGKRQWLDLVNSSRELMSYKIELERQKVTKEILAYRLALKNGQIDLLSGEIQ